jgi:hypothetical protein
MDDDWRPVFDGTLDGWTVAGDEEAWTVDDGDLLCLGGDGGTIYTDETFEDFEVALEYRHEPGANSGLFLRISEPADVVNTGVEVQILDTHGTEDLGVHDCGALYDMVAPAVDAPRPAGEWNELRATCDGPRVSASLNGHELFDVDVSRWDTPGRNPDGTENKFEHAWADQPREGHVGLQDHTDRIRFRNVRLRELQG